MALTTPLSQLNNGSGVQTAGGITPDFQITARDGTTFQISVSGANTVQDVINDINTATGGKVIASLATTGSGLVLTDTTGATTDPLSIKALNNSNAAAQLGLSGSASSTTLTGTDVGAQNSGGIFGNLQALMSSLQSGNAQSITAAGEGIQTDINRVVELHGQTGAYEQELSSRQTSIQQQTTATQTLLSQLKDVNMAQAISQFETLQTALQANLETAASTLQISLMNFIA
jgi:flagellar hook-associated protein 3 FlgL